MWIKPTDEEGSDSESPYTPPPRPETRPSPESERKGDNRPQSEEQSGGQTWPEGQDDNHILTEKHDDNGNGDAARAPKK